jgi:SAM-dependent methyltransferase
MRKLMRFLVRNIPRPWLIRFSGLFSLLIIPFYRGSRYQCPICNNHFRKLLPYGNQGSANRLCPSCLSLERHRLLWLYLKERTAFFHEPLNVLHVAPEQSFIKRFRALPNLRYNTADLVSPLADLRMDIQNIPMPDGTYDVVICNHVLEHVESDHAAIREIYRVLKPGGWAIMQVPVDWTRNYTKEDPTITSPAGREKHFGQYDHVRYHGTDYPDRLRQGGFEVDEEDFLARFTPEQRDHYRLPEREMIWRSNRPSEINTN